MLLLAYLVIGATGASVPVAKPVERLACPATWSFSPNGKYLLSTDDRGTVRISRRPHWRSSTAIGERAASLEWADDSRHFACEIGSEIKVVDALTGRVVAARSIAKGITRLVPVHTPDRKTWAVFTPHALRFVTLRNRTLSVRGPWRVDSDTTNIGCLVGPDGLAILEPEDGSLWGCWPSGRWKKFPRKLLLGTTSLGQPDSDSRRKPTSPFGMSVLRQFDVVTSTTAGGRMAILLFDELHHQRQVTEPVGAGITAHFRWNRFRPIRLEGLYECMQAQLVGRDLWVEETSGRTAKLVRYRLPKGF